MFSKYMRLFFDPLIDFSLSFIVIFMTLFHSLIEEISVDSWEFLNVNFSTL